MTARVLVAPGPFHSDFDNLPQIGLFGIFLKQIVHAGLAPPVPFLHPFPSTLHHENNERFIRGLAA